MKAIAHFVLRWLKRLFIGLGLLIATVLLVLAALQLTSPGRALVLKVALTQVNALIPGTLHAKKLDRLSLLGVGLWGVQVFDPQGTEVARVEHLFVETKLWKLLEGTIALKRAGLSDAFIDLRVMEERRGLLASFVDPDAPESPPSDEPPPTILIDALELSHVKARLPQLDPLGQLDVDLSELRSSFGLIAGDPELGLRTLALTSTRGAETLLTLKMDAKVPFGKQPTEVHVDATSGPIKLQLDVSAVLPTQDQWHLEPLRAEVSLSGINAPYLAHVLRDESLKSAFLGEVALALHARGTAAQLEVEGQLKTAGGTLRFDELSAEGKKFHALLSTDSIQLDQLRADLPPRKVAAELTIETEGLPPDPLRAKVLLRRASVDEVALMDLELQGVWTGTGISDLSLKGKDGDSRIAIEGELALEGESNVSAQIDLRPPLVKRLASLVDEQISARVQTTTQIHRANNGRLKVEGYVLLDELVRSSKVSTPPTNKGEQLPKGSVVVQHLRSDFSLVGTPPDLSGKLTAEVQDAAFGEKQLDHAKLEFSGNARDMDVILRAKGGVVPADQEGARQPEDGIELALDAHVSRRATSTTLVGQGSGQIQAQTIDFDLKPTTIEDSGAIATEGIDLAVADQHVHVEGQIGPHGASQGMSVRFGPINLSQLPSLSSEKRSLVGVVSGHALLKGNTSVPILEFAVSADGVGLKDKPTFDVDLSGQFDASEGVASFDVDVSGKAGLSAEMATDLSFPSGPRFASTLNEAEGELRLELRRLDTKFLEPYLLPTVLPVMGSVSSSILVSGSLAQPKLDAHTELVLKRADSSQVSIENELGFEAGELETSLNISDRAGPFAELQANVALNNLAAGAQQLGQEFARVLSDGTWALKVKTQRRALIELPLIELAMTPGDMPPVSVQLALDVSHEPAQEPKAQLTLSVKQSEGIKVAECDGQDLVVTLDAQHHEKSNTARIVGRQRNKKLLLLEAETELLLAPILAGGPLVLGPVDLDLSTEQLQLSSLPFMCDRAQGLLEARVIGKDLLGKSPHLEADLSAKEFSLGSQHRLDLSLVAEASQEQVTTELKLKGREQFQSSWGHIKAQLPWAFSSGKVELKAETPLKVQLELSKLPIAPLLPPKGAISYASGTLDAKLNSSGTLKDPALVGQIELNDIAFTSTSVAQPLRDINGRLRFSGRKVFIEELEAHDQDGELTLSGHVDLSDLDKISGTIDLAADSFPLRQRGQVAAVTTFKARAESTVTPQETRAKLTIKELDTWLESVAIRTGIDLSSHDEFVIDGTPAVGSRIALAVAAKKAAQEKAETSTSSQVEPAHETGPTVLIIIDASQRFWVKRDDFAVKLNTLLKTEINGAEVRIRGDVTIDRGYLQLFGKVFDLKRESVIRFIGSSPPNPVLELEAEHKTRGGSMITVRITGRGETPVLQFFIDGNEVDAGLAVQELFGGEKGGGDTDATTQAQSFVSGLTAGVLATAARRELGAAAPIMMIDPSDKAGEGRVRAGFELDDIVPAFLRPIVTGAYLEGIVARESSGATAATTQFGAVLELYFPKNLFTAGQYGPGTTWSIDFGWQL